MSLGEDGIRPSCSVPQPRGAGEQTTAGREQLGRVYEHAEENQLCSFWTRRGDEAGLVDELPSTSV